MTERDGDDTLARLRELFIESVDLPPVERAAFLADLRTRDPAVAAKLAALFDADAHLTQRATEPLLPQLAPLRRASAHWVGRRIGAWTITRELGAGGMGAVYLGEPDGGGAPVAIKVLHADFVDAPERRRFLLERGVLARLSHPLIARYVDAGEHDGSLYAVMEYVDGAPILAWADRARLTLRDRVTLFLRLCAAVAHAHTHRVVHRDIKSSNVLVGADGVPKLLDFGIAKPLQPVFDGQRVERTATAQRWFSPHSAAPEQISGAEIGVGTDVYGLGVLLYELLCGEPPFELAGLTAGQIENTILGVEPDPPSLRALGGPPNVADARARLRGCADRTALADALYGELDGVALMALRKNAGERYASVDDFAADLRNALGARPTEASRARRFAPVLDAIRRHRVVAAIGVVALAAAAFAALSWRRAAPPAETPIAQTAVPPEPVAAAVAPEARLAHALTQLRRDHPAAALELVDGALATVDATDATVDLRVRLYDTKVAALLRLADIGAARAAIDDGLAIAATPRQRALLGWRRVEILDARGRGDEALAVARELAEHLLPSLGADDALALAIRARVGNAPPVAAEPDCATTLAGGAGVEANAETVQRFSRCIAQAGASGDAASQLALQVAYGRLLNRTGDYAGAARVLDAAIASARNDPALRRLDTHRVATLASAIAHYGADASDDNRARLRGELTGAARIAGDAGRLQWIEQSALARALGVSDEPL